MLQRRRWAAGMMAMAMGAAGYIPMASAHDVYMSRIPNGASNRCKNCHVNPAGGGTRNAFGSAFSSNRDTWNATLARMDSDHDTWSNGAELGDSLGMWHSGMANPVPPTGGPFLPADPASHPTAISGITLTVPDQHGLALYAAPNPFNPATTVHVVLPEARIGSLELYDVLGRAIANVYSGDFAAGDHAIRLDANGLPSGRYWLVLRTPDGALTRPIDLMK